MQKYLLMFIIVASFFRPLPFSAASIHDHQININIDRMTVKEIFDDLSRLYGMEIVLLSNLTNLPQGRFSLDMKYATVEQAIKEVMRRANVQNHALILDREKKSIRVWILSTYTQKVTDTETNMITENDMEPLTLEQMRLLAQNSQGPEEGFDEPLAQEKIEVLREQSIAMDVEFEESIKPLTSEQIEQLREESLWIEAEMEEAQLPLSIEQMEQLMKQSIEIELENEINPQPLSKEQLRLIKEQGQHY